jgi:hypothetical protein
LPRKKKDNLVSLAKKTNDSSKYTTKELLEELLDSDVPVEYKKCICIVSHEEKHKDGINHKFNYFIAGHKSRIEILGILAFIKNTIINELYE